VRVARFRHDRTRREGGAALFITALILMLVGMLAVTAIYSSERESVGGARSRSTARTFYAAEQSRTREQAAPQPIEQVGVGAPPEGYSLNVGSGGGYVSRVYRVNATARAGGSTVELEAKLSRTEPEAGGY
jgi:hypothetical protein